MPRGQRLADGSSRRTVTHVAHDTCARPFAYRVSAHEVSSSVPASPHRVCDIGSTTSPRSIARCRVNYPALKGQACGSSRHWL